MIFFSNPNELKYLQTRIERLKSLNEQLCSHIDFTNVKKYRSCPYLERFNLYFESYDTKIGGRFVRFCCSDLDNRPGSSFCGTSQETAAQIKKELTNTVSESKIFSLLDMGGDKYETRKFTSTCAKCDLFQLKEWKGSDGLIHLISFTMSPSPCQCRCIYCGNHKYVNMIKNSFLHLENARKVFDTINCLKNNDMIANDLVWQMASGEITIHPFKDQIYSLIGNQTAHFFTNCFIYDKSISINLATNPNSVINLSIDSGTPQTWKRVKGVDNFSTVLDNLRKYSANCIKPEQITLKYLILPGINDSLEDYTSVIDIMKSLKIKNLDISCDMRERYSRNKEQSKTLSKATGYLLAMLEKNNISYSVHNVHFSSDELKNSFAFSNELLSSGII